MELLSTSFRHLATMIEIRVELLCELLVRLYLVAARTTSTSVRGALVIIIIAVVSPSPSPSLAISLSLSASFVGVSLSLAVPIFGGRRPAVLAFVFVAARPFALVVASVFASRMLSLAVLLTNKRRKSVKVPGKSHRKRQRDVRVLRELIPLAIETGRSWPFVIVLPAISTCASSILLWLGRTEIIIVTRRTMMGLRATR